MVLENWADVVVSSLQNLWLILISFLPSLLGALLVLLVGLIVAAVLERIVERLIYHLKLDSLLKKTGLEHYMQRANLQLNAGHFVGRLVYWFIVLAFLLAASDILRFTALSSFLDSVLVYLPNVVVAVLILLLSLLVAKFVAHLVKVSVLTARFHFAANLSTVAWWTVMVFGFLAALSQLGIALNIINALVTGFIAMIAIAGGLAFGLGGKDMAAEALRKLK